MIDADLSIKLLGQYSITDERRKSRGLYRSCIAILGLTGTSVEAHLTELRRGAYTKADVTPSSDLCHLKYGHHVKIGGLIVERQRLPTAKGFAFLNS